MRTPILAFVILTAAACGPSETPAPEAAAPPAALAAPRTLADFAGTWENLATLEGVAEPVPSTITGSAAGDDWTMTLEGRPSIPVQVSVVGDSLIAQTAEYESVLRPGVMVRLRTASVLQGDTLMGNVVATYRTAAGEEQVRGTMRGTRVR
jgi:hypothetical protein